MPANALVQTRIDPEVKDRAAAVLERMGLTVSDAVRMLLTRTANEGALPFAITPSPEKYDAWFRKKVQEALDDPRPMIPHEEVVRRMEARRAELARRIEAGTPE